MSLIVELIYHELMDRLRALNGSTVYGVTFAGEEFGEAKTETSALTESIGHGDITVEWSTESREEAIDVPGNPPGEGWRQLFNVRVAVRDESSTESWGLLCSRFAKAVKNAVDLNSESHTLGGYAIDRDWGEVTTETTDGGARVIVLPLSIVYRVSEYDAAVQR